MISEFKQGQMYKCTETVDDGSTYYFVEGNTYLCITNNCLIDVFGRFRNVQNNRSNFEEIKNFIFDNTDKYKYNYI